MDTNTRESGMHKKRHQIEEDDLVGYIEGKGTFREISLGEGFDKTLRSILVFIRVQNINRIENRIVACMKVCHECSRHVRSSWPTGDHTQTNHRIGCGLGAKSNVGPLATSIQ